MSAIYFHSQERGSVAVRGPERGTGSQLAATLTRAALGLDSCFRPGEHLRSIVDPNHYAAKELDQDRFARNLSTAIAVGMDEGPFLYHGRKVDTFLLNLNTGLVATGGAARLLVRLHGQCEVHAYVEGPNRRWLSDIIERGRAQGVLREGMGWEAVVELLRLRNDMPIVTSYSVCDQFPNPTISGWEPTQQVDGEPDWDEWYDRVSDDEKWARSLEGIRGVRMLELRPDDWDTLYFGDGLNAYQLMRHAIEKSRPANGAK